MSEYTLAKYNSNEIKLNILPVESFEYNKGTYTIKWVLTFGGVSQTIVYELTTSKSIIATRVLNRTASNICLSYFWIVTAPEMKASVYPRLYEGDNTAITQATLVENTGGHFVTPGSNFEWYGFRGTWDAIGTVADCNPVVEVEADFPIFLTSTVEDPNVTQPSQVGTYWDSDGYLDDYAYCNEIFGDDFTHIILASNYTSVEDTIPRNKIYYINNRLKKNGTIVETKRNEFQIAPDGRIWLVAPEHSSTGQTYNMTLYMQGTGMTFKHRTPGSPWTVVHLLTPTLSKYYYGEWTNYNNGDFYNAINNTNIPIFADTETGDRYGDGLIDEDFALNAGELENRRTTTGSDLESTDIPNITVGASGIGCNVWALDRGNINAIMSILFDDDQTIIDDIKKGTWLWGNNPADFIISCYFVPFAITNFYDTTTERVYLGFYDTNLNYTRVKESKSSGQRITLVNTTIDSVYGDWRDYTNFKYEIYLPYVGFYPLDVMSYLNKTLTVEMAFDIMTHNIRYYLFANGKIVDRVDGSVGYDIPLMATDQVNKAKSDLAGITNVVKGGVELAGGVATGNIGMLAKGGMDTFKGVQSGFAYPKQEIVGNVSSSMNIYDINYCYLKITEKDTLKPDNLNTIYNYPSYFIGNVSELSGYTIIDDLQFACTGTSEEINEILSLLRGGAIL